MPSPGLVPSEKHPEGLEAQKQVVGGMERHALQLQLMAPACAHAAVYLYMRCVLHVVHALEGDSWCPREAFGAPVVPSSGLLQC